MFTIQNLLNQALSLHKQNMEASKNKAKVSEPTADKVIKVEEDLTNKEENKND